MAKITQYIEHELAIHKKMLGKDDDSLILPFRAEILAIAKKFEKQGHSNGAPMAIQALTSVIEALLNHNPITPITNDVSEWDLVDKETQLYQNKRLFSLFKNGIDGRVENIRAIIFVEDGQSAFISNSVLLKDGSYLSSTQIVKEFPFTPNTFYVPVVVKHWEDTEGTIENENGTFTTSHVKDENCLVEIFNYYDRYEVRK